MGKVDIEFSSKCSERTDGCIEKGICGVIILRSEQFTPEYPSQCLCDIQKRTVWRQEKEEQAMFLPYRTKFPHELAPVYTRIVKNY